MTARRGLLQQSDQSGKNAMGVKNPEDTVEKYREGEAAYGRDD